MHKFTVTIQYEGHKLEVHGSDSPFRPATGPTMSHAGGEPAEGGLEEISEVYLLDGKGKRIDLPDSLQEYLADTLARKGVFDEAVNAALEEARQTDPEDHV